jgi:hypothetical protein
MEDIKKKLLKIRAICEENATAPLPTDLHGRLYANGQAAAYSHILFEIEKILKWPTIKD